MLGLAILNLSGIPGRRYATRYCRAVDQLGKQRQLSLIVGVWSLFLRGLAVCLDTQLLTEKDVSEAVHVVIRQKTRIESS